MKVFIAFLVVVAGIFFYNIVNGFYCKKCNFKEMDTTNICGGCNEKTEWASNKLSKEELEESKRFFVQEANLNFEKGVKEIKANNLNKAKEIFIKIEKSSEKYEMAQKYIKEIEAKKVVKNDYFKEGQDYKRAKRYTEALEALKKVSYSDVKYEEAKKEIKELEDILLCENAVEIRYEELTRNVSGNIGKGIKIYGKICDIQENGNKSIVAVDVYNEITGRETDSLIIKVDFKIDKNVGEYVELVGKVEGEFLKQKDSIATWFKRGYTIYTNANAKSDRIPVIKAIELN